jgi:hypothetical protein
MVFIIQPTMADDNQIPAPPMGDSNTTQDPTQTKQSDNQDDDSQKPVVPIGSFGKDNHFAAKVKIPVHNLNFDETYFLRLLAGSISLTKDEKKRIIQAIPKLSQFQIDELIKILEEEKRKFSELDVKHKDQLKKLEEKHAQEWEQLEMNEEQEEKSQKDESQADEIRKNLGL